MLPKNTLLTAYLRTVPDLIYRTYFKYRHPNEMAWSQKEQKVKREPVPALKSNDLHMPICLRVEDVRFNSELEETVYQGFSGAKDRMITVHERILKPETWAIIKRGRYKGDLGIIVYDDFGETDTSTYALLQVIPRMKFPGVKSRPRPPKAPLPVDFTLSPRNAWQSFVAAEEVKICCIDTKCTDDDAWDCDHQEYCMK